jgi:copper(I)-binding protein
MNFILGPAVFMLLAANVTTVPAPGLALSQVTANHGTIWEITKAGETTQGFFQIRNDANADDTLTSWSCAEADTTTLAGPDGKAIQSLDIPAGKTVTLAANGPHLILQSTHFVINEGSAVPCSLTFQNQGQVGVLLFAEPAPKS